MKRAIAALCLMLLQVGLAHADTCAVGAAPCTLPCIATTSPTQVLAANGKRTDLIVVNTGATNYLYVILGQGALGSTYAYGIPVAPGQTIDLQVQPNPNTGIHTWTSTVSVATVTGTTTCVYGELGQ